jgi:hypothetical protein
MADRTTKSNKKMKNLQSKKPNWIRIRNKLEGKWAEMREEYSKIERKTGGSGRPESGISPLQHRAGDE